MNTERMTEKRQDAAQAQSADIRTKSLEQTLKNNNGGKTMKTTMSRTVGLAVAVMAALAVMAASAWAAPTPRAVLSIDVSINSQLSVKIDESDTSTRAALVTPGGAPVVNSVSTVTVRSDATAINEFWKLASADAPKKADGSAGWTLKTSSSGLGTNEFAMQALFVSSNVAVADYCGSAVASSAWDLANAAALTTTPTVYTAGAAGKYAYQGEVSGASGNPDFTAGGNDGRMKPSSFRGLCYRIVPPSDVTFIDNVMAYVIVTASLSL